MNLELICWIAAGIIIAEIVYIIWYTKNDNEDWYIVKLFSYLCAAFFMLMQSVIVFSTGCGKINTLYCQPLNPHYEYLLIELAILSFVALLLLINGAIAKKIDKNR